MLIVIEGLDGCGKATQSRLLADDLLKNSAIPVHKISFPVYSSESSRLVQLYLNGEISPNVNDVNAFAASSFFAADRYINYKQEWEKYYKNNHIVIADRYTTANQLYQATKLPEDKRIDFVNWISDFEYNKLGLPEPDLTIMLRCEIATS